MTDQEKLNKKLARWRGLKLGKQASYSGYYLFADTDGIIWSANFTGSLDACFKWLVPKIVIIGGWVSCGIDENEAFALIDAENDGFYELFNGKHFDAEATTPALALCLAIEKLIDEKTE